MLDVVEVGSPRCRMEVSIWADCGWFPVPALVWIGLQFVPVAVAVACAMCPGTGYFDPVAQEEKPHVDVLGPLLGMLCFVVENVEPEEVWIKAFAVLVAGPRDLASLSRFVSQLSFEFVSASWVQQDVSDGLRMTPELEALDVEADDLLRPQFARASLPAHKHGRQVVGAVVEVTVAQLFGVFWYAQVADLVGAGWAWVPRRECVAPW